MARRYKTRNHWSLARGDHETCARLIVPLADEASDEQAFLDHFQNEIAVEIDERMLYAFTGGDYAEAVRILGAAAFAAGVQRAHHQDRAQGPGGDASPARPRTSSRSRLVTPLRHGRPRKAHAAWQIEYLARRLRLIQATQMRIPGGISYGDAQYLLDENSRGGTQLPRLLLPGVKEAISRIAGFFAAELDRHGPGSSSVS